MASQDSQPAEDHATDHATDGAEVRAEVQADDFSNERSVYYRKIRETVDRRAKKVLKSGRAKMRVKKQRRQKRSTGLDDAARYENYEECRKAAEA
ncbi:hypothetical protein ACMFMG_001462 [Clarireedia jacksonii]